MGGLYGTIFGGPEVYGSVGQFPNQSQPSQTQSQPQAPNAWAQLMFPNSFAPSSNSQTGGSSPPPLDLSKNANIATYGSSPYESNIFNAIQSLPSVPKMIDMGSTYSSTPQNSTFKDPNAPFSPAAYTQNPYQAKDMSNAALPQFDMQRQLVNSQYSQQQSQAQDSLDRQFAAMGGGPGNGAQLKQTENLATGFAKQKSQDLLNIGAQEAQTRTALQQQQDVQAFQSGEAQKGYAFQAGQANTGYQFAQQQADTGYGFQAGQADLTRQFAAGESEAQRAQQGQEFTTQMQQQLGQERLQGIQGLSGMDLAYKQAQEQALADQYNIQMNQYTAQHSGGLFGGGGFLGTGLF